MPVPYRVKYDREALLRRAQVNLSVVLRARVQGENGWSQCVALLF